MSDAAEISAAERDHVFHSWSAQGSVNPLPIAGGEGCWFWDHDGNRYLDLASQLVNVNLGHQHPRVVAAIRDQAERLCTVAPQFGNETRSTLARLIVERAPGDLDAVFFTNGGTEAVEHAVRMARLHTGRHKVLSAYRSYHGATAGSITLTGDPRRWANEPGVPGVARFFGPHLYRSAFHATTEEEESDRALRHLAEVIQFEGPDTVAAVLLEPVVGTNGVLVPPPGYLAGVRELCDRHGILLISDEVMVGFGRVGEWFAVDAWDVTPDLITFAKGVNSGYVPLGGVVISRRIADTFTDRAYPGGLTYSGHPLACAAGVASIQVFEETDLLRRVRRLGSEVVEPALRELAERHPSVGHVRGRGLFWAVELVRDRDTREPLVPFNASGADAAPMNQLAAAMRANGVWPFVNMNRLHLAPPLVISEEELALGLKALDEALAVTDALVG
ncbi:aspartate aminotransferase family protein [Actinoalloteichus sp. AHMU CJ021]|uniref:Taurine---2-oxoglutarate transaminase n=1 Tax=Actinoalloteichus caeruleus DSM 43889 TaxID=1120930 RepID=A0ABT1JDU0_ACTCY|nr:aspartate aminotransferase family protein [Actinoalloteichus caeruleus]AUS79529.1 aspartate aminotransferase family protein [Actinoalloteichus sp. AHMU CJ021]MCP2330669.1 taurine---2-oxoglutarate transaminase [Actinoalloteichus caeruleus DSM 43889]